MALDSDIAQAADALALERLRVQEIRNQARNAAAGVGVFTGEAAKLLTPDQEVRLAIVKAIGANYMKPTTGYLPDTIEADAKVDAARLRLAVAACLDIVKNG